MGIHFTLLCRALAYTREVSPQCDFFTSAFGRSSLHVSCYPMLLGHASEFGK